MGSVGTCAPFAGPPLAHNRPDCTGGGTACHGVCDGSNGESCSYPTDDTTCAQSCDDGDVAVRFCDGAGHCVTRLVVDCGLFVCRDAACVESCQSNDDCVSGAFCDTSTGSCAALKADGDDCTANDQCEAGVCSSGTCGCPRLCDDGTCHECCSDSDCPDPEKAFCPFGGGDCTCGVSGQACDSDHLCCDTHSCRTTMSGDDRCCKQRGEPCTDNSECCIGCDFDTGQSRFVCV